MRVIEFVGTPGAGKSSQIECLLHHCENKGLRAVTTNDRERIARIGTPSTERMMFGVVLATQAVEFYHWHRIATKPPDVLFLDRGWNDVRIWSEFERGRGSIASQERTAMQTIFASYAKLVERTIYMHVPPEVALERHKARIKLPVDTLAMKADFLKGLNKTYDTHWYQLSHPHRVDGRRPLDRITQELLSLLKL
jgi:thymidylate kinase